MTTVLCIAGFGDNASMFDPLQNTQLAKTHALIGVNLPGFGAPPLGAPVTLKALADVLHQRVLETGARVLMAHSVASIIAVLAAQKPGSPIEMIVSLEGNLTPEDAYFSGSAAAYSSAEAFRAGFLDRLGALAETGGPDIARYRQQVLRADTRSLWELGCDAHAYSNRYVPGDELIAACRAVYLFNPENLPAQSRDWLSNSRIERCELPGASHWPTFDQPHELSEAVLSVL